MSIIKQALNSEPAQAYYAAAAETWAGVDVKASGVVRKHIKDWKASDAYQAAAFAAYWELRRAFHDALAELGRFARQVETDDQLTHRIACELTNGGQTQGTADFLEYTEFMRAVAERRARDADLDSDEWES